MLNRVKSCCANRVSLGTFHNNFDDELMIFNTTKSKNMISIHDGQGSMAFTLLCTHCFHPFPYPLHIRNWINEWMCTCGCEESNLFLFSGSESSIVLSRPLTDHIIIIFNLMCDTQNIFFSHSGASHSAIHTCPRLFFPHLLNDCS